MYVKESLHNLGSLITFSIYNEQFKQEIHSVSPFTKASILDSHKQSLAADVP